MSSVGDVPRDAAEERGDAEDDDADREDEPAAVAVGQRAGREDERGERDRVRVDDPLQARQARVEARRWTLGSATFTIVMSTSSMNVVAQTATSVQRRAGRPPPSADARAAARAERAGVATPVRHDGARVADGT